MVKLPFNFSTLSALSERFINDCPALLPSRKRFRGRHDVERKISGSLPWFPFHITGTGQRHEL
jgi:hypothetical protein